MTPSPKVGALMLTPGAGAGRDNRTLVAVEAAVAPLPCLRMDFPYRIAGRRAPDRVPVAVAHIVDQSARFVDELGIDADQLVLGGRSYGGRMCSMAVAQGLPAAGLILLSYPLHPPGKPEKPRIEHFPGITVPVLFVSGERDPFGSPDEFAGYIGAITGPVTQAWLPGGHDPKSDVRLTTLVGEWLAAL